MSVLTVLFEEAAPTGSSSQDLAASRPGPLPLLVLSGWCGLIAGLLEVGATTLRQRKLDLNHLYWMSRHFVRLMPRWPMAAPTEGNGTNLRHEGAVREELFHVREAGRERHNLRCRDLALRLRLKGSGEPWAVSRPAR